MAGPASASALAVMLGAIVEMLPQLPWYEELWPAWTVSWVPWMVGRCAAVIGPETHSVR